MRLIENSFCLEQIMIQPTTLCNLNCTYCYLGDRNKPLTMSPDTTTRLASAIAEMDLDHEVTLIWHGGEPLACGIEHFSKLIEPFNELRKAKKLSHGIQTNATLISPEWCDLFIENQFGIGVSIDGPAELNRSRVDWAENESFPRIMAGIKLLSEADIKFSVLSVVGANSLPKAKGFYEFICSLGCISLGINIEEKIGIHSKLMSDTNAVESFWRELLNTWRKDPKVRIREFQNVLYWMNSVVEDRPQIPNKIDIFPCIGWNGDVVLLSPELVGVHSIVYENFVAGNIGSERLSDILANAQNLKYVSEYQSGVQKCQQSCRYFSFCRGGQAANKFFEAGILDTTETTHCKNSQQIPCDVITEYIDSVYDIV